MDMLFAALVSAERAGGSMILLLLPSMWLNGEYLARKVAELLTKIKSLLNSWCLNGNLRGWHTPT
jgi:hypothetical protein